MKYRLRSDHSVVVDAKRGSDIHDFWMFNVSTEGGLCVSQINVSLFGILFEPVPQPPPVPKAEEELEALMTTFGVRHAAICLRTDFVESVAAELRRLRAKAGEA